MAIGAFAPVDIAARNARMIIRPKVTPVVTKAPIVPPEPVVRMPISRIPIPTGPIHGDPVVDTPVIFTGGIITETVPNMGGGTPTPSSGGNTTTTTGGSSSGTDTDKLLGLLSSLWQGQEVAPSMAPVSFAATDTNTDATGGAGAGSSKGPLILVALLVIGGIVWYVKTKGKKKAAA